MNFLKQAEETIIAEETAKLFFAKSIADVTIRDIAIQVGIGEATIYRRFGNKYNLVLIVAKFLQDKVFSQHFDIKATNGYEYLRRFYEAFINIYKETPEYYKFINEFDAFVTNNSNENMTSYEEGIDAFRQSFIEAYKNGLNDGSVQVVEDIDAFYFASTHSLMGLCKKLADRNILTQDYNLDKVKEIQVLIDTILYRLNKNR